MSSRSRLLADVSRPRVVGFLVGAGLVAFVAGLIAGLWLLGSEPPEEGDTGPVAATQVERPVQYDERSAREEPAVAAPRTVPYESGGGARVALVIDDLGRSLDEVRRFRELGVTLSWAVLPFEARSREVVEELLRTGAEVLCHLPMEPFGGGDPGPGALTREMSPEELATATRAALARTPGVLGVNNHMGSALSEDREALRAVLAVLAEAGLYYLDSRTNPRTVGYATAVELGLPAAERRVFLDPDPAMEKIREQFATTLAEARLRGEAIAIGHPLPTTLAVLRDEIPRAVEAGFEFVVVSELLDRPREPRL